MMTRIVVDPKKALSDMLASVRETLRPNSASFINKLLSAPPVEGLEGAKITILPATGVQRDTIQLSEPVKQALSDMEKHLSGMVKRTSGKINQKEYQELTTMLEELKELMPGGQKVLIDLTQQLDYVKHGVLIGNAAKASRKVLNAQISNPEALPSAASQLRNAQEKVNRSEVEIISKITPQAVVTNPTSANRVQEHTWTKQEKAWLAAGGISAGG